MNLVKNHWHIYLTSTMLPGEIATLSSIIPYPLQWKEVRCHIIRVTCSTNRHFNDRNHDNGPNHCQYFFISCQFLCHPAFLYSLIGVLWISITYCCVCEFSQVFLILLLYWKNFFLYSWFLWWMSINILSLVGCLVRMPIIPAIW